ncbi:hypothetical protein [Actinokineospora sp.]|uniref:hypothetical protein n=1 Tax=Actinokineospora sp. TaxID=1872133 RepID=UPI0040382D74
MLRKAFVQLVVCLPHLAVEMLPLATHLIQISSPERRAKHWLDTGRALSALPGREDAAVTAFRESERLAALRLRANVYARESVTDLLPRVRRDTSTGRELRGIAYRMGISA